MRALQLIFLLGFSLSVYGQNNLKIDFDYSSFALRDSIDNNLSFEETVKKIKSYGANDTQRLCLVAGWIFKNVAFDLDKFNTGGVVDDYKTVFAQRKGVCGDYSALFSAFCNKLNITNEIIEGYVPEHDSENLIYYETNHAWNVVKLGSEWYHCDLLGFSGHLKKYSTDRFEFIKQPNVSNFLNNDLPFLAKHIPADPIWQLSNYPIPLDTLIANGKHSKVDSSVKWFDYKKMINRYTTLNNTEKQLLFADNAFVYNKNNSNVIVSSYYNAAVDLINGWNNDKNKLVKAKEYLRKSRSHIANARNDVAALRKDIDAALEMLKKYVP